MNSASLLALLFPGLKLTPRGDEFKVNDDPNWTTWVNSRAEGRFTQSAATELAIIVANDAPHIRPADIEKSAPWGSFLAIFSKQDSQLILSQKAFLFPTAISPLAFDVKIDRVVDFDHDDQDELLIATNASRMNTTSTAAFLYQWNDVAFVEVWSAPVGEDNTGAINQKEYRISDSQIQFSDVNADGIDEIIVDTTRVDYAQDSQGLADLNHESARRVERRAFRWGGKSFVSDPARSTPLPPLPTPVP